MVAAVFLGESVVLVLFVLLYPKFQVAGDAYVDDPCPAGHDVGVVGPCWHLWFSLVRFVRAVLMALVTAGGVLKAEGGPSPARLRTNFVRAGPSTSLRSAQDDGAWGGNEKAPVA